MRLKPCSVVLSLIMVCLAACGGRDDGIKISHAWAPATPPGVRVGAVYMSIESGKADVLLGVRSSIAETVELHRTSFEEGMAQMRKVDSVVMAPSTPLVLETAGLHMMLMNLSAPLLAGQSFEVTLSFQRAGEVRTAVKVNALDEAPHSQH